MMVSASGIPLCQAPAHQGELTSLPLSQGWSAGSWLPGGLFSGGSKASRGSLVFAKCPGAQTWVGVEVAGPGCVRRICPGL